LATTDVMLASTVQFSRYGRSRLPAALAGAAAGPAEGALRPFPQDPTACSAREPLASGVPSPYRGKGCTSRRELVHGPNNQCSTSEHPSSCSAPQQGSPAGVPGGRPPGLALRASFGEGGRRPPSSLSRLGRCSLERR